mgnify:CR=1 FL=1
MVFYRKYRPQTLGELIGQEEVKRTLESQLTSGKIGHAYLFYGTRGTGKTSTARILAKAVNCEKYRSQTPKFGEPCNKCQSCIAITNGSSLDLVEIDAASNRGIDEIRDLREKVKLSPVSSPYKVYIIDEVHMLTTEAFNALLKTLEEPPKHAIFILATTEYSKLPATILSRLQKFNFKRASKVDIASAVTRIARSEKIKLDQGSASQIAEVADGSFRDAVSLLDQLSANGEIKQEDVSAIAKVSGKNQIYNFVEMLIRSEIKPAALFVEDLVEEGVDISLFIRQTVLYLEKVLYFKIGADNFEELDENSQADLKQLADSIEFEKLQTLIRLLIIADGEIKIFPMAQIPLVLAICKFIGEAGVRVVNESNVSKVSEAVKHTESSSVLQAKEEQDDDVKMEIRPRSGGKGLVEVEKNWSEFLNRVRPLNAHVVALLRSTKPFGFDGESLTLEVFYKFHKDKLEEPKIMHMLDSKMEETIGRRVRLKFILAKRESTPTVAVGRSDVVDVKADELEKIAQEIFSK